MGNIVLLDDLTINKIAAGEVIERPLNVVKEVVENSIDAGATKIIVEIKKGGKQLIKVIDNGKGIPKDDMDIALERHATSKLRKIEDLEKIYTMGFRGEALASIVSVAKLTMISRTSNDDFGTKLVAEAGDILEREETGAQLGTTIMVENLFFNVPVRYKFLKQDATEFKYIKDWIQKAALSIPSISFKLINEGKVCFQSNGNGKIEDVIYSGKDIYLFIKDLISHYRNLLMAKVTHNPEEVLDMSEENIELIKEQSSRLRAEEIMRCIRILQEAENNAKLSKQARLYCELAIIKMCKIEYDTSSEVMLTRLNKLEESLRNGSIKVSTVVPQENNSKDVKKKDIVISKQESNINQNEDSYITGNSDSKITINDVQKAWRDILEGFKARRAMVIGSLLQTGRPVSCSNGIVTVEFEQQYKFGRDRLSESKNTPIINEVFSEILKENIKVNFVVGEGNKIGKNTEDILREKLGDDFIDFIDE